MLEREEYIEQAYFFRTMRERVAENLATQDILLRIDSPGGSYVASDAIWREVVRRGAPAIVLEDDVALASLALPGTNEVVQSLAQMRRDNHHVTGW